MGRIKHLKTQTSHEKEEEEQEVDPHAEFPHLKSIANKHIDSLFNKFEVDKVDDEISEIVKARERYFQTCR